MNTRTMEIRFTDGARAQVTFTHQETREGELHVWTEYPNDMSMTRRHDEHWFPVANIRDRWIERD